MTVPIEGDPMSWISDIPSFVYEAPQIKHRPGCTTQQQKLRSPKRDCNYLTLNFLLLAVFGKGGGGGGGNLASISIASSSSPITVFSALKE